MNASQRANWEQTRAKGFWYFVLLYWVPVVGGTFAVVLSLIDYFFGHAGLSVEKLLINLVIALIVSFIGGAIIWLITERRYQSGSADDV